MLNSVRHDVAYGLRTLRKAPGFAAVAVLTLAVGIGANTVVFSVLNTLYFRAAPVRDVATLVSSVGSQRGVSLPEYEYYRDHNSSFSGLAGEYPTAHVYLQQGEASRIALAAVVTENYFDLLGVSPRMGRFFAPTESAQGTGAAVLSFDMWQRDFAGDEGVVGKTFKANGLLVQVIGVAPKGFHRLYSGFDNDLWLPTGVAASVLPHCNPPDYKCQFLDPVIGRLKPGHQLKNAQAELNGLNGQWESLYPDLPKSSFSLFPARGIDPHNRRSISHLPPLLLAIVAILLLICCANLSGLLLARGAARSKEIAVRLALGARRGRLIRQLLTEAALLGTAGALCGLLLLEWSSRWFATFPFIRTEGFRSHYDVVLDIRVLLATLSLSMITVFVFGAMPALRTSRPSAMQALKQTALGNYAPRLRAFLVAGQVTLAVVLSVGAVLVVSSMDHILLGPGFDAAHIAIVRVSPYRLGYPREKSAAIQRETLRRLQTLPGVKSVSFGQLMPWWESWEDSLALPGQESVREEAKLHSHYNSIAPGYLQTLQVPLLRGREFTDSDRKGTPEVVVVNEALARKLWGMDDAIGKTLVVGDTRCAVVGVARDAQYTPASDSTHLFFYRPYWQIQDNGDSRFFVRTAGSPAALLPEIKRTVRDIDASVPVGEDASMSQALLSDFGPLRLTRAVLVFSGAAALFLTAVGLYGIVAFLIAHRTREIGIRLALGATRAGVLRVFLRQGMKLALAGAAAGILVTMLSMRVLARLLYGTSPTNGTVLFGVAGLLLAVCALASFIPARRATKVDPIVALRYE